MRLTREEAISHAKEKCTEDFLQYEMRLPLNKNFQCFDSNKHKHGDKSPSMRYNRKSILKNHFDYSIFFLLGANGLPFNLTYSLSPHLSG